MATQVKRMKMEAEGATIQSLNWDIPAQMIGEKNKNAFSPHCCMRCTLPIYTYGRMLGCRHILCYDCAKKTAPNGCLKCGEKVNKLEAQGINTIVMCYFGGPRHGPGGCRRTYLSQRDMEAHVKHRHKRKEPAVAPPVVAPIQQQPPQMMSMSQPPPNMSQPPPRFMAPPTHIPAQMMAHSPHSLMQQSNTPPRGHPVSMQQAHSMQSNSITMQGSMQPGTIQAGIQPMQMQQNTMAQMQTQVSMAPMQSPANLQPMSVTQVVRPVRPVQLMQTVPPNVMPQRMPMSQHSMPQGHQIQSHQQHQQMQAAPRPHVVRQHRPPPQAAVRPMNQPAPVQSKSHGNLISIPIQGSNNWSNQGQQSQNQQQWPNQQGGQQHY